MGLSGNSTLVLAGLVVTLAVLPGCASTGHTIHYIQMPQGATLASLAAGIRLPDAEAQLRLLNGLYPRGEPRTGDWIKGIR